MKSVHIMATSASSIGVEQGQDGPEQKPRRTFLRRTQRNVPSAVWITIAAFGVAVLVVAIQLVLYLRRHEPRDARAQVQRELQMNTLQPGERVVRAVPVFRRSGVDYFRQTRGLLVLTDKRLIYLGAPPRDITGSSDAPPTFDQRVFRYDTLTKIQPSWALLGLSHALRVETPNGSLNLGIPSGAWPNAQMMREAWAARHRKLQALGIWAGKVRVARADLDKQLEQYRKQPVYHVVRPGDAVSSIASWYETTPEQIQQLNGIVGNKIKVGQKLLIRKGS